MDLSSRFPKDKENYYLSYSGGRDSHFLYWFIKEYLKDDKIEIVSVNTYMEHHEILKRMLKNADRILIPELKPFEIKERYGSPCFSKYQDSVIYRYQSGNRCSSVMKAINRKYEGSWDLSKKASTLLLNGDLHKVSAYCCTYLKKNPFHNFEKQTKKHPILGVRGSESNMRKKNYSSCFSKNGKFHPLYDLTDNMLHAIEERFNIEVPNIYDHITRTGCAGCPYGSWKHDTEKELRLVTKGQRNFLCKYFKESYDVLGIDYKKIQQECGDFD